MSDALFFQPAHWSPRPSNLAQACPSVSSETLTGIGSSLPALCVLAEGRLRQEIPDNGIVETNESKEPSSEQSGAGCSKAIRQSVLSRDKTFFASLRHPEGRGDPQNAT